MISIYLLGIYKKLNYNLANNTARNNTSKLLEFLSENGQSQVYRRNDIH